MFIEILRIKHESFFFSLSAWTDDYFTENKEALRVRSQKQDTTSQSRMRPDQTISNSVASWKLKYRLGAQTKKNFK